MYCTVLQVSNLDDEAETAGDGDVRSAGDLSRIDANGEAIANASAEGAGAPPPVTRGTRYTHVEV